MSKSELDTATKLTEFLNRPVIADLAIKKLREGTKPLAIAKLIQMNLMEFQQWHPQDLADTILEAYRSQVPLEQRIQDIDNPPAVERSIARQMEVSTPRHVLEKMLFLTLERIEMEHGLELQMQDGGEIFIVGREKTPSRLSPMLQREVETARRLAKDLHAMSNDEGGTIDGQAIKVDREETDSKMTDKLLAQMGRLAKRILEDPDILAEPVDVEFKAVE